MKIVRQVQVLDKLPTTLFEFYKYYLKIREEEKALKQLESAIEFSKERKQKIT
ncbi:hypothetical protein [Caloranaerobacter sp. TR13]|uniref:hypothetical protein n=1 Tax=Caloranaerobacter sp. TR13 TaxID=1302151 RepID=UPI00137926E2|nr:hypothetical protein [Caloranaerobacter sp. TR13]